VLWLDLVGALALGISGGSRFLAPIPALLAGLLVAAGGGVIRDVGFGLPLYIAQHPAYIVVALAGGALGHRLASNPSRLIGFLDLAATLYFAYVGASRGLAYGLTAEAAAVAGVITALGGGAVLTVVTTVNFTLLGRSRHG